MNLNMIRPKNQIESLLLSSTKNCETLIEQTHKKQRRHWDLKWSNPEKQFISVHLFK